MAEPNRGRIRPPSGSELPRPRRRPEWIRLSKPPEEQVQALRSLMRGASLHTVCEEAMCPNLGECWSRGTATFLLLGDVCTRACRFCDVKHGRPGPLDPAEPERVARAAEAMNLRHVVITSVNRDDQPDGGAAFFAETIRRVRGALPECTIEVLIPDFKGDPSSLQTVLAESPEILNHNIETVPRLFRAIQPQDRYEWAEAVLRGAKRFHPQQITKSGIMVGLGETFDEVVAMMRELRAWGVDILTVGQYLQPSRRHLPVERYYPPEEFAELKRIGLEELAFRWVESSPLVRSSYRADAQAAALAPRRPKTV
ncbi:MAG: lipoyl synthase [Anaerolineales bacterium]|nr:lipoyl synthase [Anaerolineales bacterium]